MASKTRQSNKPPLFRARRGVRKRGASVALHAHDEALLIFPASGTMQVHTEFGQWFVPPQLGVWIPAEVPHRIDVLSNLDCRMIYWHPSATRDWAPSTSLDRAFALRATPLLRELIFTVFKEDAPSDKIELAARLILHELTETPDAPTFLPLPASAIGRRVAELALSDPRNRLDLGDLASGAATSVRTISRLFPNETGLTFKVWRQRARIVLAIDRLAMGSSVSQVGAYVGFASSAAFCYAFRQVTKMTPAAFLNGATLASMQFNKRD